MGAEIFLTALAMISRDWLMIAFIAKIALLNEELACHLTIWTFFWLSMHTLLYRIRIECQILLQIFGNKRL